MSTVTIMRGLPGSGKTHWLKQGRFDVVCSADDYFVQPDGSYVFDAKKIREAHFACFRKFLFAVGTVREPDLDPAGPAEERSDPPSGGSSGLLRVAVDNTGLMLWEVSPYVLAAESYGHTVQLVEMVVPADLAFHRQTHGVSRENFEQMARRLESALPWWQALRVDGVTGKQIVSRPR
jgi:hypothetical protein